MAKNRTQRVKYLRIMEILRQESDENRPIATNDLIRKLEKYEIKLDRRTLYEDINVLNDMGYEVLCKKSTSNMYYVLDRQFDVPELRILMDAVESANFITEKKTSELITKIADLGGSYRSELMTRNLNGFDTCKHTNESVYYTIDAIDQAIHGGKKLSFQYFDFTPKGERAFRDGGLRYKVSPLGTIYSDGNYYLAAYYDKYKQVSNFRVDRMIHAEVEEERIADNAKIRAFDINAHKRGTFGMFTGEVKKVDLCFDREIIDVIFDKFGEKTGIVEQENGKCVASVFVRVSPMFFGFICGLSDKIKIISPAGVVSEFTKFVDNINKSYS